ncbi:hypothetical protein MP638_005442 [Amoeboaphelidium occidentale]|nr:hypothetical protein MP638_005442 [Amoeboaphelidium occidentale]
MEAQPVQRSATVGRYDQRPGATTQGRPYSVAAAQWNTNPLNADQDESQSAGETTSRLNAPIDLVKQNVKSKSSSLAVKIHPMAAVFTSPGKVAVLVKTDCSSSKLRIRDITVDFIGTEEVKCKSSEQKFERNRFLKRRVVLQSPETPPSAAVSTELLADPDGYWKSKIGQTEFEVSFDLPEYMPSSVDVKLGKVYYEVVCSVTTKVSGDMSILSTSKIINVAELSLGGDKSASETPVGTSSQQWGLLSKGTVEVSCQLDRTYQISGLPVLVNFHVDNKSKTKVSDVEIALVQRIKTFKKANETRLVPLDFERKVLKMSKYKHKEFVFSGKQVRLPFVLPQELVSVLTASIVEVSYVLSVTANGSFSKAITVELPITIGHLWNGLQYIEKVAEEKHSEDQAEVSVKEESPIVEAASATEANVKKEHLLDSAFQSAVSLNVKNDKDNLEDLEKELGELSKLETSGEKSSSGSTLTMYKARERALAVMKSNPVPVEELEDSPPEPQPLPDHRMSMVDETILEKSPSVHDEYQDDDTLRLNPDDSLDAMFAKIHEFTAEEQEASK